MTIRNTEIEHWQALLQQHRSNLSKLRDQQAFHGPGEARLIMLNQIRAEESSIREAKAQLRQFGVEPARSTIDPPEVIRLFPEIFIKSYPLPIAQACSDFNQAADLSRRFVALDRLINQLIKYLAAVFIGQARLDRPPEYPLPERLEWIATPTLENWAADIASLSGIYIQRPWRDRWKVDGLLEACTRPLLGQHALIDAIDYLTINLEKPGLDEPSVVDFLQLLAWYSDTEWSGTVGAGQYPVDKGELFILQVQPAIESVLDALEPVRKAPLVYVERADDVGLDVRLHLVKFMGRLTEEMPGVGKPILKVPRSEAQHVKRNRLYIARGDGLPLLEIHPFFVLYHWELYLLENHQPSQYIEYRSCNRGIRFRPPVDAPTYYASWWQAQTGDPDPTEYDAPPLLGDEENWQEHVEVIPSDEPGASVPLTWLDTSGRQALEVGLGEALRIGRFWLGVEFLLMGLSKQDGMAFPTALRQMDIDPSGLRGVMRGLVGVNTQEDWRSQDAAKLGVEALPRVRLLDADQLRQEWATGNPTTLIMTPRLSMLLQDAFKLASGAQIGHNHLVRATLRQPQALALILLMREALSVGRSPDELSSHLLRMTGELAEDDQDKLPFTPGAVGLLPAGFVGASEAIGGKQQGFLSRFGRDLTQTALKGQLHAAIGESAHQAMVQLGRILLQREANNPLLLGDAGTGKTAIVEGFAWRLANQGKRVADQLAGKRIIELSAASLLANTSRRGDLENRIRYLLEEVKAAKGQIIVFIDEIHSILGGGATGGLATIADALKPALARGEFPCIGATTVAEYRAHIEKDPALARRFTPVWIQEPSVEEAFQIVREVAIDRLVPHHGVHYTDDALVAAVQLSDRYIQEERLPGKAIKILDEAAPSVLLANTLSGLDDLQHAPTGVVTIETVQDIIAARTNIPVSQLGRTDSQRLQELPSRLKRRVKGQDEAVDQVVLVLKRAGAGLSDHRRPQAVFLFAGPSGVGKTELALALAEALFDDERSIFRLDMSEIMERHEIARLIGAPPGYVRSEEEGYLTAHLRRRPYSVVLLDEMEKAHPDVQHIFLQLFDSGRLTDNHGNVVDGRKSIFIMTTNLGARESAPSPHPDDYETKLRAAVAAHFSLEFLNRIDRIVYFASLSIGAVTAIFDLEIARYQAKLREKGIEFKVAERLKSFLLDGVMRSGSRLNGRLISRTIEDQIISPLMDQLLEGKISAGAHVIVDADADLGRELAAREGNAAVSGFSLGIFLPDFAAPSPHQDTNSGQSGAPITCEEQGNESA